MPENLKPNEFHSTDDELARFADDLLGGGPQRQDMSGKDQEHLALEETVTRLDKAFKATVPDQALSSRVRANLIKEWQRSGPQARQPSFWERWRGLPALPQPQFAGMVAAIAAVALVVLGLSFVVGIATPTPGSAGLDLKSLNPAWLVGGVIVLAGALWMILRRRR